MGTVALQFPHHICTFGEKNIQKQLFDIFKNMCGEPVRGSSFHLSDVYKVYRLPLPPNLYQSDFFFFLVLIIVYCFGYSEIWMCITGGSVVRVAFSIIFSSHFDTNLQKLNFKTLRQVQ